MSKKPNYLTEQPDVEPGEMTAYINQALELAELPQVNYNSPEEIRERCQAYFAYCARTERRPCVQGLCLALGCVRQSLINWEKEQTPRGAAIRKAKQVIRTLSEEWLLEGKVSPPSGIFILKQIAGYCDNVTITAQTAEITPVASMSKEQIAKILTEDIPAIDDDPEPAAIADHVL